MKRIFSSLLLLWLFVFFASCSKETHAAIASKPISDTINLPLISIPDSFTQCMNLTGKEIPFIIRSQEVYNSLPVTSAPRCQNFKRPYFDFSKAAIVFYLVAGGGCADLVVTKKQLVELPNEKKYVLFVSVEQSGNCEMVQYTGGVFQILQMKPDYGFELRATKTWK